MSEDMTAHPLSRDLDYICDQVGHRWEGLRGATLFITGGTGFVGKWMLESLVRANANLDLGLKAHVLSRDPQRFASQAPHLAAATCLEFMAGDVCSFEFPDGPITHALHMATETDTARSAMMPSLEFNTAVEGTRRVLRLAVEKQVESVLYTSSGAVYGKQPVDLTHVPEDAAIAPPAHDVSASYSHGKRAAEFVCGCAHVEEQVPVKIARLFAFVGPHLPMGAGYAVGNFIRDAIAKRPIGISGDGTPMRSYLYAADLAWWLWTILLAGDSMRPYNVGSDAETSIADLAKTVADTLESGAGVEIAHKPVDGVRPPRYVPDITRARQELGLSPVVSLEEGVRRTAEWHHKITS